MSNTAIESGIPLPGHRGGYYKHPWHQLDIGQSFVIRNPGNANSVTSMASRAGKRLGRRFTTSVLDNGDVRVWRIE